MVNAPANVLNNLFGTTTTSGLAALLISGHRSLSAIEAVLPSPKIKYANKRQGKEDDCQQAGQSCPT